MDESTQQAIQLGVNITIFVVALSVGITLMMGVRNVADKAFEYDASIPTGSRIVTTESNKARTIKGYEILSYVTNYMIDINHVNSGKFNIVIEKLNGNIVKKSDFNVVTYDNVEKNLINIKELLNDEDVDLTKEYEVIVHKYNGESENATIKLKEI